MEDKTITKIFAVGQTVLAVVMLALITFWGAAHLYMGHFNLLGFGVYALVWYIIYRMTTLSTSEAKAEFKEVEE